jgi:hypothetical protein
VAFTVVLRRHTENVRERFYAGKDPDALARTRLGGIAMEAGLGRKRLVSLRYIQLGKIRAAARIGCPF